MKKFGIIAIVIVAVLLLVGVGLLASGAGNKIVPTTVTFKNSTETIATSYCDGVTLVMPADPTKDGFTFNGWFTDEAMTAEFDKATYIASKARANITLYAKFTKNKYTVTFNEKGGSEVSDITAEYNAVITLPTTTKEGYTFKGWSATEDGGNVVAYTNMPAEDVTLYAWFIKDDAIITTVTFKNGADTISIADCDGVTLVMPVDPTKEGFTFNGWFTDKAFSAEFNKATYIASKARANITLYAKFVVKTNTITFDEKYGSEVSDITADYNSAIKLPTTTKVGYTFNGWSTTADGNNIVTYTKMPADSLTLYAKFTINRYTMTFNEKGGSDVADITGEYNSAIKLPTTTKLGYTFKGWSMTVDGSIVTYTTMPAEDVTLYAVFTVNRYTMTFDEMGGSDVDNITADYNTSITLPTPTKEGYTFKSWSSTADGSDIVAYTNMPAKNVTLYARFIKDDAIITTVTFMNGTETITTTDCDGVTLPMPVDPSKDGFTFNGWFTDKAFGAEFDKATYIASKARANITLYAKFTINRYTITFDEMGGSAVTDITADYNTSITLPKTSKLGYTFKGWSTTEDGSVVSYTNMPAEDVTLYAVFTINKYTITFDEKGGSAVTDIIADYNTSITLPKTSKLGYTFKGWSTTVDGSIVSYTNMPAEDVTLYAVFTINRYTIAFKEMGGSIVPNITDDYNSVINLPTSTKLGYTFKGWSITEDGNNIVSYTNMPAEDLTLYAVFVVNKYTITFKEMGGSIVTDITADYNFVINLPRTTKEGYTFNGWSTTEDGSIVSYTNMPAEDVTLYAVFTINRYTITFDEMGGSIVPNITDDYNSVINLPTSTKLGYTFKGWSITEDGNTIVSYTNMPAEDVTLYAVFTVNSYTITFNVKGGSDVPNITADYNASISLPTSTLAHYTFKGWSTTADGNNIVSYTNMPAEDVTLYAVFMVNKYTITFVENGGSEVSDTTADYDSAITLPKPTKKLYAFSGWCTTDGGIDIVTYTNMPAENITLYAVWNEMLEYTDDGNGGWIVSKGSVSSRDIAVPALHEGKPVTAIAEGGFSDYKSLTSITIPNRVTTIGYRAFQSCTALTSITLPNSITTIGAGLFSGCTSLTSITIPDSVTTIGTSAFENCTALARITIPDSVTDIGTSAFENCSSLISITIPNGVTDIQGTFSGCTSLISITIPDSVTDIGGAFYGCTALARITIPNSVTSIGQSTFSGCRSLTSIIIPDSVTTIGQFAFYHCTSLTSITIPNSVTTIEGRAFQNCTALASITLPDSVTTIEDRAFSFCTSLASITIPNSVTTIGVWAFENCTKLANIIIPDSVTTIEDRAFFKCTSLASITLPNSVTTIGEFAFSYCESLTSITIPNKVTTIERDTFSRCTALSSITLPNSVTTIGESAFSYCKSLTSITIPNSVTTIEHLAFEACVSLTSIFIPKSVTTMHSYIFSYCSLALIINVEILEVDKPSGWNGGWDYTANVKFKVNWGVKPKG